MPVPLDRLLAASPYLRELSARNSEWLKGALGSPDDTRRNELEELGAAAAGATDENEMGAVLRAAKGRIALLAAAAETSGAWTTADSTAALSDLADAALEA